MIIFSYMLVTYLAISNTARGELSGQEHTDTDIFKIISEVVSSNYKHNGWAGLLCYGAMPDEFYRRVRRLHLTHLAMDAAYAPPPTAQPGFPNQLNTIVISCDNFADYSAALQKITNLNNWNPHANIILRLKKITDRVMVAKIFYTLWWHQSLRVVVIHHEEGADTAEVFNYTPYTHDGYQLETAALCWAKKRWTPFFIINAATHAECELGCGNLTLMPKIPRKHLITCLSFDMQTVHLNASQRNRARIRIIDQTDNMHGFPLKSFAGQILPFQQVELFENGSYELRRRDGEVWRTLAERMNFTIHLVHLDTLGKPPPYAMNTNMLMDMAYRLLDLVIFPIYQLDLIVAPSELCAPLRASGVCILAHRAGFESSWMDSTHLQSSTVTLSATCLVGVWGTIAIFKYFELGRLSFDQLGKDLCNTVRNILSLNLHRPPRQGSFRVYLAVSLWCFFILNFLFQASIVSFMTVLKRGKEVDTFADIVQRGYPVKGFWSPDMILPEEDEVIRKFNKLKIEVEDFFSCVNELKENPRTFCLLDCTIAHYLEKNQLNRKGEQYIHVVQDRIHSLFLNMILPHKSPLKRNINKYIMALVEGGFVKKFEGYRYDEIHQAPPEVKPVSLNDLRGIFQLQTIASLCTVCVFFCEVIIGFSYSVNKYLPGKITLLRLRWIELKKQRQKKVLALRVDAETQTFP